jgi:hypothetical protein
MIWVAVSSDGTHYVYREWPNDDVEGIGSLGEWALPDSVKADGRAGPAQTGLGWGIARYKEEIERAEGEEEIACRWIDSIYASASTQTIEGGTTLLEECLSAGLDFMPTVKEHIDEGISLVNDLLDYERGMSGGVSSRPKLLFSSECKNVIFALQVWTGKDGRHGASKDPIDVLRYMAGSHLVCFDSKDLNVFAGGAY